MLPERTLPDSYAAGPTGALSIGDVVEMYGKPYEVHGVMLVEGGPQRMLVMVPEGGEPHPFDWMPETSVLRHAIRRVSGAAV